MERYEMIEQIGVNVAKILARAKSENRALKKEEQEVVNEYQTLLQEDLKELPGPRLTVQDFGYDGRAFDRNVMVFQDSEGKPIEAISNAKRFSALKGEEQVEGIGPGSLGKILRAKILGDPLGLNPHEFKALGESTGSGGGWFVSPALSGYVIDLARSKEPRLQGGALKPLKQF